MLLKIKDLINGLDVVIYQKSKYILHETGKDISLDTDKRLNKLIIQFLEQNYPFPILSEEATDQFDFTKQEGTFWIIDPLDGTLNFSRSIPLCCISIALVHNGFIALGIVYDLHRKEIFVGNCYPNPVCLEITATLNDEPLRVSSTTQMSQSILCTGFPSYRNYDSKSIDFFIKQVQDFKKVRCIGTAALSLSWVACGRVDAYFEEDIRIWDIAAGFALVKAAGGTAIMKQGKNINFVHAVASNGIIDIQSLLN